MDGTRMRRTLAATALAAALATALGAPGAAAETLTLGQAVARVLENHPEVRSAEEGLKQAAIAVDGARASFQPEVSASAGTTGRLQRGAEDAASGSLDANLTLTWNLYRGGADAASLKKALENESAEQASLAWRKQTLVKETVQRYLDTLSSADRVAVREQNLVWNRGLLDQVRAQHEAGSRAGNDVYQQEAQTEQAVYDLTTARGSHEESLLLLAEAIGEPQGATLETAPLPAVDAGSLRPEGTAEELVTRALAARPDIVSQRAAIAAAEQTVAVAAAGSRPTVSLTASAATGYDSVASGSLTGQTTQDALGGSVGLTVSIPLWDQHGTRNAVAQGQSQYRQERSTLESLERAARLDVGTALKGYRTAESQVASAAKQLEYAGKSLEAAEARYRAGVSTLVEVSQARSLYLEANNSAVTARYNLLGQAVAVAYATGELDRRVSQLTAGEGRR